MSEHDKNEDQSAGQPSEARANPEDSRRDFLKLAAIGGLGAGGAAVVLVPGAALVAYPLNHATTSGSNVFVPAGKKQQFKPDGEPVKVDLYTDKTDAWNRINNVKVGSAWVLNHEGKLTAFSTVCPHLGCAIDYEAEAGHFKCPCHRSAFTKDGKVEAGPSPRPMDSLEVKEEKGLVQVKFQRFRQGQKEKEAV